MTASIPMIVRQGADPAGNQIPSGGIRRCQRPVAGRWGPRGVDEPWEITQGGAVSVERRIEGGFWDRLRRWLPTPQERGPDPKPLPTPWRRAPDSRLRRGPGDRGSGLPA